MVSLWFGEEQQRHLDIIRESLKQLGKDMRGLPRCGLALADKHGVFGPQLFMYAISPESYQNVVEIQTQFSPMTDHLEEV